MAFDADGAILAAHIDYTSDCGAYPTPWPVMTTAVVGMLFPGPYRVPLATFATKAMYTNTAGRTAYRGPWQFESLAREVLLDIAARQMRHGPGRAAAAQPAASGRAALRQPQRHDLRPHLAAARPSSRPSRCSTTTRSGPSRPRPAAPAATSASASPPTSSRPPRASATTRTEGGHHPHRAVRQGQRLHRRRLDRQQHRDHGRPAHRRRARRGHRRRQHDPGRHRGDGVRRRRRAGAAAVR